MLNTNITDKIKNSFLELPFYIWQKNKAYLSYFWDVLNSNWHGYLVVFLNAGHVRELICRGTFQY